MSPKTLTAASTLLGCALGLAACDEGEKTCDAAPGIACTFMGTALAGLGEDGLDPLQTDLYLPQDVTAAAGGTVYVIDWNNHRIRTVRDGVTVTVVGTGYLGDAPAGTADEVSLNHPTHITEMPDGKIIVSAWHNSKILQYDPASNHVEPICGTGARSYDGDGGPAIDAVLDLPVATALGPDGSLYIADQANQRIRRIAPDGIIDTFAGNGVAGFSGDGGPAIDAQISLPGGQAAPPAGRIATDAEGRLYIADSANHRVRRVDTDGTISTIAGDGTPAYRGDGGPATAASLFRPSDVEVDRDGNVFVADTDNSCVRKIAPDGTISTAVGVCGSPGLGEDGATATEMFVDRPYGIALDDDGTLYVADTHNHRIVAAYPE
jgi:sugar lactone lactonase YvrE